MSRSVDDHLRRAAAAAAVSDLLARWESAAQRGLLDAASMPDQLTATVAPFGVAGHIDGQILVVYTEQWNERRTVGPATGATLHQLDDGDDSGYTDDTLEELDDADWDERWGER